MSQDYYDDCFSSTNNAQGDMQKIESNFAATKSNFSGTGSPPNPVAGMSWVDFTNHLLKLRNEANTAWQAIWDLANQCLPPNAIPNDYITSAMLNSAAGSEAVTRDVIRAGAVGTDELDEGDLATAIENAMPNVSSAVGVTQLKIASGSASHTGIGPGSVAMPGGFYGFFPQIKSNNSNYYAKVMTSGSSGTIMSSSDSYSASLFLGNSSSSGITTMRQYYIQNSPPYKIGNITWGHFIFYLRTVSDKKIISTYEAEDPPWAYNGPEWHPKDSKARIMTTPHPFPEYQEKNPADDGLEIVMADVRHIDVKALRKSLSKKQMSFTEHKIPELNPTGNLISRQDLFLPEIPGFTDRVKILKIN